MGLMPGLFKNPGSWLNGEMGIRVECPAGLQGKAPLSVSSLRRVSRKFIGPHPKRKHYATIEVTVKLLV